jgi:TfoX/Sxy family transcriptional regulator of competence genes
MAWKKASQALIETLEEAVRAYGCDRRVMFGSPTFFVNNNMFAGVFEDTVILRLSEKDRLAAYSEYDEVRPFTPMAGRPMKEYAAFPESITSNKEVFGEWLGRSYRYAASLAPKEPRRAKKRNKTDLNVG